MFLVRQDKKERQSFSGFFTKKLKEFLSVVSTKKPTKFIRPSEITYCTRYIVGDFLGLVAYESPTPSSRRIMDNGNYVHKRYLEKYIPQMGIAVKVFDKKANEEKEFIELSIKNADYWIKGSPDALIFNEEDGKPYVFELKSINDFNFDKLTSPEVAHIAQVQIYMFLTDTPQAVVFYENKDTQATKEFLVLSDDKLLSSLLQKIRIIQGYVNEYPIKKILPSCDTGNEKCRCSEVIIPQ